MLHKKVKSILISFILSIIMGNTICDPKKEYELGLEFQTFKQYPKALKHFTISANKKYSPALYQLGDMYLYGRGVVQDSRKAVDHYKKSADLGNCDAQYRLGDWHYKGVYVLQDDKKALEYFTLSAEQGHKKAQQRLNIMKRELE